MGGNTAQPLQGWAEVLQFKSTLKHNRGKKKNPRSRCTDMSERRLLSIVKCDTNWYRDCSLSQMHSVTAGNKDSVHQDVFCSDAWRRKKA